MDNAQVSWNKLVMEVFNRRRYKESLIVGREDIAVGQNLIDGVEGWSKRVIVTAVDDGGITAGDLRIEPGQSVEIEEFMVGMFSSLNGYDHIFFHLDGHTGPYLEVHVITAWYDTQFHERYVVDTEALRTGADIAGIPDSGIARVFPHLTARLTDENTVEIDGPDGKRTLSAAEHSRYATDFRDVGSETVEIEGNDVDLDSSVRVIIEVIP